MTERTQPFKNAYENAIDAATWPKWMRISHLDELLIPDQRKEAAKRLRARADELDPPACAGCLDDTKSHTFKPPCRGASELTICPGCWNGTAAHTFKPPCVFAKKCKLTCAQCDSTDVCDEVH